MIKQSEYNPDKLMSYGKDSLFIGGSFSPSTEEIPSEDAFIPCHLCSHEPENTSEVPVTSFGDFALPFKSSRLIDRGIKSGISDKF